MIVKLKCVSNIDFSGDVSNYLTVGNVYDGVISPSGDMALVDDEGCLLQDNLADGIHGKWEVVN